MEILLKVPLLKVEINQRRAGENVHTQLGQYNTEASVIIFLWNETLSHVNMFTSRWHSESSQVGFNDRSGADVSGHGGRSLQEVESKAEVKTICLFKHPLQLITLSQGYAQGDPDMRQKSLISTDEHDQ